MLNQDISIRFMFFYGIMASMDGHFRRPNRMETEIPGNNNNIATEESHDKKERRLQKQ